MKSTINSSAILSLLQVVVALLFSLVCATASRLYSVYDFFAIDVMMSSSLCVMADISFGTDLVCLLLSTPPRRVHNTFSKTTKIYIVRLASLLDAYLLLVTLSYHIYCEHCFV